jgi:ferredoxin
MSAPKIQIDKGLCGATGFCERIAPELFELSGPDGLAVLTKSPDNDDMQALAREAMIACPTGAISMAGATNDE